MNDFETYKPYLINYIESITTHTRNGAKYQYICPICQSGTGANASGAFTYYHETNSFYCYSCGNGGDIYTLIELYENKKNKLEQLQRAKEFSEVEPNTNTQIEPIKKSKKTKNDFFNCINSRFIKRENKDYFHARGFSDDVINNFSLSVYYDNQHGNFIFPIVCNNSIQIKKTHAEKGENKIVDFFGECKEVYNADDFNAPNNRPIFIVEGLEDCLSFKELGFNAVALLGREPTKEFYSLIKNTNKKIILALDNDEPGREATKKIINKYTDIDFLIFDYSGFSNDCDINDIFKNDKNQLKQRGEQMEKMALEQPNKKNKLKPIYNDIETILHDLKGDKYQPIKTGFSEIDTILDGGIYTGLTVLGAESSLGKSTLFLNIAENLAERKNNVFYFSLEMSKMQLLTRGISRQSFLMNDKKNGFSSGEIKKNLVNYSDALEQYRNKIANNLFVYESHGGTTIDLIKNIIIENKELEPIIFIDYLQMVSPSEKALGNTDKQQIDYSIEQLKGLSSKYNLKILVISALNRESYGETTTMKSLKESGKIEYTADFVLALNLTESYKNKLENGKLETELNKTPRDMTLEVLKGRDIATRKKAKLNYYSKYNCFTDENNLYNLNKKIDKDPLKDFY